MSCLKLKHIDNGSLGTFNPFFSEVQGKSKLVGKKRVDYSPFGVELDGRTQESAFYRYSMNGMEKDDEVSGSGNSYNFGARMYNSRVGRFLSVDPLIKSNPSQSSYLISYNNPVFYIDKKGESGGAYWDEATQSYVIAQNVVVYTGNKKVFNKLSASKIKSAIEEEFNSVIIEENGQFLESTPTLIVDNKKYPVRLEVTVQVLYDPDFNGDINDPDSQSDMNSAFERPSKFKSSTPGGNNATTINVNLNATDPILNFFRVESDSEFSKPSEFSMNGNSGIGRYSQLVVNGVYTTTWAHEILAHGLMFQLHPEKKLLTPCTFDCYWPLNYPENAKLEGGGDIDENMRQIFQSDLNTIDTDNLDKSASQDKPARIGGVSLSNDGKQLIYDKNGTHNGPKEEDN